jgi:hypothetical protein
MNNNGYNNPSGFQRPNQQLGQQYNERPNQNTSALNPKSYPTGTYPNDQINNFGLRDKYDQGAGLVQVNPNEVQITALEYTLIVDTRDCIGIKSLKDAQAVFESKGGRPEAYGTIVSMSGSGVSPISITFDSVDNIKDGDTLIIKGALGNTAANGPRVVYNVLTGPVTGDIGGIGNGTYNGSGSWFRPADPGYPTKKPNDSQVVGNKMIINLNQKLRDLRTISLYHIVIPRDIIPLTVYLSDFISASTDNNDTLYPNSGTSTSYISGIPQEESYMNERVLGFYSTPLDMFRTYSFGAFSMQDQVTPAPLQLWNPPGPSVSGVPPTDDPSLWPLQPYPYPYQTVPSYRSNIFPIPGQSGDYYLMLAGHGLYDLADWTVPGISSTTALQTSLIRKLLLFLISPKQSYRNSDYITLILNSNTVTVGNFVQPYGYGDFQRFVPGPGNQQNYQPGTSGTFSVQLGTELSLTNPGTLYSATTSYPTTVVPAGGIGLLINVLTVGGAGDIVSYIASGGIGYSVGDVVTVINGTSDDATLTITDIQPGPLLPTVESPVPFPNFRGNVWGPYDAPGDRFQKLGLRTVIQDLYLNGDLNNLLGSPTILPNVPTEDLIYDQSYGLNFSSLIETNLGNIDKSTNPNILNAMRIVSNGFGAVTIRANGTYTNPPIYYENRYQSAGGQGPSNLGVPSSWVNTGVYGGTGTFTDPIAQGPFGLNITPQSADPTNDGTGTGLVTGSVLTTAGTGYTLGIKSVTGGFGTGLTIDILTTTAGPPGPIGTYDIVTQGVGYVDGDIVTVTGGGFDATLTLTVDSAITHRTSFYDLGPNNGSFLSNILNYIAYVVNDVPDTDLIIKVEEASMGERYQSTNSRNGDAILDCPIRLNLGTTSGTFQYVESLQSLIAAASSYWEKRFLTPRGKLDKLHISFFAYEGQEIPLEKMLQIRRSLEFLQSFVRVNSSSLGPIDFETNPFAFTFLFDPLNPQLVGREKRYFQIIFKVSSYQGTGVGMEPSSYQGIPPSSSMNSDVRPYA